MTFSPNQESGVRVGPDDSLQSNPAANGQIQQDQFGHLRVCLITTEFHGLFRNGGIGTANTGLALALSEAGFDVTVAFADADEAGPRLKVGDFTELQKKYGQLGISLDFVPADPLVPAAFEDCRSASYCVYLYLKKHTFDVVYFNDCGGQGYYSLLAKHVGAFHNAPRMYVVAHGPQEWVLEINSIAWTWSTIVTSYLERRSTELADALISPSQYMVDWMTSQGWALPARVLNIQNIVTLPASAAPMPSSLKPVPVTEIVFFGRLEVRKGLELFCDAIDLLNQSVDLTGIKVTFMGKFGQIAGLHSGFYLVERARRWRSSLRILARYGQDEALSYLNRLDRLAVIPSYVENSPCVVAECLQLGMPFVATASGGTVELVAPEDRDLCLVAADPQVLATKLGLILESGHRPARMAFSKEDVRAQWLTLTGRGPEDSIDRDGSRPSVPQVAAGQSEARKLPLVSICLTRSSMPSGAGTLIESILRQTYPHLEIILFDDGVGPDPTALAALGSAQERISLRLLPGTPGDRGAERNAAAAQASGDYLLFVEEGRVVLTPECIEALVTAALRTGVEIVTVAGLQFPHLGRLMDQREGRLRYIPVGACAELGAFENCFGDGAFLIDRAAFERRGGFATPCDPNTEEWLFLAASVLSGLRLELVPDPLVLRGSKRRTGLACSPSVANQRRILEAYGSQSLQIFKHAIEIAAQSNGPRSNGPELTLDGPSAEAREIAQRISSSFDPNSEEAFRGLVQFCIERQNIAAALDFALYNGRSLLHDVIGSIGQATEAMALDSVRHNTLEMWHDVALTDDIRQRVQSVSVFPVGELERPLGAVASHSIDAGIRILKASGVCPPGASSVRAVARVETSQPAGVSLALAVSAPNARLRLSKEGLESNEAFWWSGWVTPSMADSLAELPVQLPSPAESLLDIHFLCKTSVDAIHPSGTVRWESVTATLLANGAVTSSAVESAEGGTPLPQRAIERGKLLSEHSDFPFPVFVPGDPTLLHPLPGRATLVCIEGAIPPGATGVRSIVSLQRTEAHPVQFAVWIRSSSAPAKNETEFTAADAFSGWFPVTDTLRHHSFTLQLRRPAGEEMDLYLATRVMEYPDVHFCHAVWHQLLILGDADCAHWPLGAS